MLTATYINGPADGIFSSTLQSIADTLAEKARNTGDPKDVAAWESAQYAADRASGSVPQSAGNTTASTPTATAVGAPKPFYKKWQFWAATGGTVAVLGIASKMISR
jgi:hypothetical protein